MYPLVVRTIGEDEAEEAEVEHGLAHAGLDTPALASVDSSAPLIGSAASSRSGSETIRSSVPGEAPQTSAEARCKVLRRDSAI